MKFHVVLTHPDGKRAELHLEAASSTEALRHALDLFHDLFTDGRTCVRVRKEGA